MSQLLHKAAISYFAAKNNHDIDGMLANFLDNAFVIDEGERLVGHTSIKEWMIETTRKYLVSVKIIDSIEDNGKTKVEGLVSGNFPGSPAKLSYSFTFSEGKIASLEIL